MEKFEEDMLISAGHGADEAQQEAFAEKVAALMADLQIDEAEARYRAGKLFGYQH